MTVVVRRACERYLCRPLLLAPEDIPVPLENRYARPHEVGADRLVGAFAARRLFPDSPGIICVDFGTATTFDCVRDNAYLGGLICPGVLSSANALCARTAKLPQVSLEIEETRPTPGLSTATSLNHGFIFGFAAMTEGICARLALDMPKPVSVVGIGGFAQSLSQVTSCFDAVRPDLLLDGLRILYKEYAT
jgi:type III pantothenate kinase